MPNKYDPTEGMSQLDLLLAGIGQGMSNTANGIRQAFGNLSKEDIQQIRDMDAALLNRGMGRVGSVAGSTLSMVPAAFTPGANTVLGAGLLGAGMGALQPSTSTNETLTNAAAFGLLGPTSIATGKALPGLLNAPIPRTVR